VSTITSLKLVATKKPINISPVLVRRNKLSAKLWEQIELAKGQAAGKPFVVLKSRTVRDAETGLCKSVDIPKRLRPWWWISEMGKVCVSIRYGSKILEGKAVRRAVEAGELDAQIEAASGALKAGFKN